jgi:HK97 family phage portal protein
MGIFQRVIHWLAGKDTTSSDAPAQWFLDWARGGEDTLSGVAVSHETAMRLSAVWTCVRVRSEDIGKLPCFLYQRLPNGGKRRASDHPLFALIRERPNPYQTAFEFRQLLQAWVDLRGNGYALKEIDGRGRVAALWPLNPTWVTVMRVAGSWELFYRVAIPQRETFTAPAEDIFHLRGLSLDGYCGVSPIRYHRETIGLGIAAQKYGAAFFGNSAQPQGAIKLPGVMSKDAAEKLRADWEEKYRGVDNAKRLAIFDGGMEWVQTGMDNNDAQYLETRKFQNQEIRAMYRLPAHKAGDLERATFSNIEQQALEYVTDCLMTEMVRWEQSLKRDLLLESEQQDYFFEFLPDALLRGDIKSRYEALAIARQWGIINADEWRDKENMNPLPPAGRGDAYLWPLNFGEAGKLPPVSGTAPNLSPAGAKELIKHLQVFIAHAEQTAAHNLNGHGA